MDLIPLHDGRAGIRALMQIETREPEVSSLDSGSSSAVLDFVSSTATLDRYHEIIEPAGWRLDGYLRNPVFQNAHNYGDILFTLGKALITEVRAVGGRQALFQRIQFATDVNPIARIAHGLYRGGFLNAVSVGFVPLRWEDPPSPCGYGGQVPPSPCGYGGQVPPSPCGYGGQVPPSPGGYGGQVESAPRRRYLEQELLEVSAVAIPANPDALALGVKSGAVTRSDLVETLDLLRSLSVDYGPWSPPEALRRLAALSHTRPQPSTGSKELITFARELRRILRRA